ncbi:uncharacterized protein RHOBADRAFT_18109, partial [Rhodotorula graminis WP1]
GTAYEGGRFEVDIVAPDRYPFEPLKIKFVTKVYHPNISSASGYICLDILNKSWSPVYTLRTCLVSLQALLSSPEPTDPQDAEVAKHYLTDRRGFEATAKFWTEEKEKEKEKERTDGPKTLARLAGLDYRDVQAFADMGFPPEHVVDTLKFLNYRDGNKANVGEEAVVMRLMG